MFKYSTASLFTCLLVALISDSYASSEVFNFNCAGNAFRLTKNDTKPSEIRMTLKLNATCDKWVEYTSKCEFEAQIPTIAGNEMLTLKANPLPYGEAEGVFPLKTADGQTVIRFAPYLTNRLSLTANYDSDLFFGHLHCYKN